VFGRTRAVIVARQPGGPAIVAGGLAAHVL